MTTITITDPVLIEQLVKAGAGEFRDATGRVHGQFAVLHADADSESPREGMFLPPPGFVSPITEGERRENRKQLDGRPLKDILRDVEKLA